MSKDKEEETNDFHDTMKRVRSVDQARIEKYKDQREEPRREPWFRRAEDKLVFEAQRKKEFHDRLQKWTILALLFLSIIAGDKAMVQLLKGLFLTG